MKNRPKFLLQEAMSSPLAGLSPASNKVLSYSTLLKLLIEDGLGGSGGGGDNIYIANGTLTGRRTLYGGDNTLAFNNLQNFQVETNSDIYLAAGGAYTVSATSLDLSGAEMYLTTNGTGGILVSANSGPLVLNGATGISTTVTTGDYSLDTYDGDINMVSTMGFAITGNNSVSLNSSVNMDLTSEILGITTNEINITTGSNTIITNEFAVYPATHFDSYLKFKEYNTPTDQELNVYIAKGTLDMYCSIYANGESGVAMSASDGGVLSSSISVGAGSMSLFASIPANNSTLAGIFAGGSPLQVQYVLTSSILTSDFNFPVGRETIYVNNAASNIVITLDSYFFPGDKIIMINTTTNNFTLTANVANTLNSSSSSGVLTTQTSIVIPANRIGTFYYTSLGKWYGTIV